MLLQEGNQKYVWVFDATVFYLTLEDHLMDVLFYKLPLPLMTFPLFLMRENVHPRIYHTAQKGGITLHSGQVLLLLPESPEPPHFQEYHSFSRPLCVLTSSLGFSALSQSEQQIPPLIFGLASN